MSGIRFIHRGHFDATMSFLKNSVKKKYLEKYIDIFDDYGKRGVVALSGATPVDTGKTAASWSYTVNTEGESVSITWTNSNVNKGENVAILLQFGHGTRSGGYVRGIDYINPALAPIFDELKEAIWKEVTSK